MRQPSSGSSKILRAFGRGSMRSWSAPAIRWAKSRSATSMERLVALGSAAAFTLSSSVECAFIARGILPVALMGDASRAANSFSAGAVAYRSDRGRVKGPELASFASTYVGQLIEEEIPLGIEVKSGLVGGKSMQIAVNILGDDAICQKPGQCVLQIKIHLHAET